MADGTSYPPLNLEAVEALRLADSVGPEQHLVARCGSREREAPCDPTPWSKEGLATLPPAQFPDPAALRLRGPLCPPRGPAGRLCTAEPVRPHRLPLIAP